MYQRAQDSHGYWELNSGPHACTLLQQSHLSSLFLDPPFFPSAKGMHINFHPFTSREKCGRSAPFPSTSNDLAFTCLLEVIWFTLTWDLLLCQLADHLRLSGPCRNFQSSQSCLLQVRPASKPPWPPLKQYLPPVSPSPSPTIFIFKLLVISWHIIYLLTYCHPPPSPSEHSLQGEKAPGCSLLVFYSLRWSPMCGVDGTDEWNKGEGRNGWGERKGSLYLERWPHVCPEVKGWKVYVHPPVYPKTLGMMLLCSVQAGDGSVLEAYPTSITFVSSHSPTGFSYKVRPPRTGFCFLAVPVISVLSFVVCFSSWFSGLMETFPLVLRTKSSVMGWGSLTYRLLHAAFSSWMPWGPFLSKASHDTQ